MAERSFKEMLQRDAENASGPPAKAGRSFADMLAEDSAQQAAAIAGENTRQLEAAKRGGPVRVPIRDTREPGRMEGTAINLQFPSRSPNFGQEVIEGPVSPVAGGEEVISGAAEMTRPTLQEKAGGASRAIRGALQAATIPMTLAGSGAPIALVRGVASGAALQHGTEAALNAAGVPGEYSALAGDVAGLTGGGLIAKGRAKVAEVTKPGARFGRPLEGEAFNLRDVPDARLREMTIEAHAAGDQQSVADLLQEAVRRAESRAPRKVEGPEVQSQPAAGQPARDAEQPRRETKPPSGETFSREVKQDSFSEWMRRDAETQTRIERADAELADIEPEAFAAGRAAGPDAGNPYDGLGEVEGRIRAAAFEAGRKAGPVRSEAAAEPVAVGEPEPQSKPVGDMATNAPQTPKVETEAPNAPKVESLAPSSEAAQPSPTDSPKSPTPRAPKPKLERPTATKAADASARPLVEVQTPVERPSDADLSSNSAPPPELRNVTPETKARIENARTSHSAPSNEAAKPEQSARKPKETQVSPQSGQVAVLEKPVAPRSAKALLAERAAARVANMNDKMLEVYATSARRPADMEAARAELAHRKQNKGAGHIVEISVPNEETRYPARYRVRELADLRPSHNPHSFEANPDYAFQNDRDYSQYGNAARVVENSRPARFDEKYLLTDSPTAEHGPTIVDRDGNALGGNNRLMTVSRVYRYAPEAAQRYRANLEKHAAKFGVDPNAIAGMKEPVLVRERVGAVASPQKEITDYNKTSAAKLNPGEQAVTDGRRLGSKTVANLVHRLDDLGESGTLAEALRGEDGAEIVNHLVRDGVITEGEKNALVDERGQLTGEGKARIGRALVGRMFESPSHWNETPPELRNKLERIAPHVLRVEGRADWNLTPVVREALEILEKAHSRRAKNLDDVVNQVEIGTGSRRYSKEALAIARTIQRSPLSAAAAFRRYANDEALSRDGAQRAFFDPPSQKEAFRDAFGGGSERGAVSLDLLTGGRAETIIRLIETGTARTADAYASLLKPLASRIADEGGGAGSELADMLRTARDRGEVAAGQMLARLDDLKLTKLSKAERVELTDALEGRSAPTTEKVRTAFAQIREMTDAVASVAVDLKLQVKGGPGQKRRDFVPRQNYFPHVIRPAEAMERGRVRSDIVDNLVHTKVAADKAAATAMLDEYIGYIKSGKKLDKLLDHLVDTGQAPDRATALARMERFKSQVKREGSLEYSREVNLPFYDPDPARVLAPHLASQAIRLTQVALFGQDDQLINREVLKIREAGGNTKLVRDGIDRILGRVVEADDAVARLSRMLRAIQTAKLGLASIPNSLQGTMNSLLEADLPSLAIGWRSALSKPGRRFAIESGAAIEPVLSEAHREFGDSALMSKYLTATGFSATEQWNRVVAANVGKAYVGRLLPRAIAADKRAHRLLVEFLGQDAAAAAVKRGKLLDSDILLGAKRFSDITQFRTRPEDLPVFASTAWGKVIFQFKTFAYNQAKLLHRQTIQAFRHGEYTRGLRTLFLMATVFPLSGAAVLAVRRAIKGQDKEYNSQFERYWDALAASSVLGMIGDVLQTSGAKRGIEFLAGPSLSQAGETVNLIGILADEKASKAAKERAAKRYMKRHLPLGQVWGRAMEK